MFNNSENCIEKCSHWTDCYKEYLIFDGKEARHRNELDFNDKYLVLLEFPTHPTTIYEISLKMQFEEYLCLIASILSLWFGFSILMLNEICPQIFRSVISRYKLIMTQILNVQFINNENKIHNNIINIQNVRSIERPIHINVRAFLRTS